MILDVHNHLGLSTMNTLGEMTELLEIMDQNGIDRSVIFTIDEKDRGATYAPQNQKITGCVKKHPDRFMGVCRIQPKAGQEAIDEMRRSKDAGLCGLKLHPKTDDFTPEDCARALEEARDLDWPVIIHSDHHPSSTPTLWEPALKNFPELFFILTHGGKDHWAEAARVAKENPNVYLDTSTLSYNRTKMLLQQAGCENIVFGSDYPYSHPGLEKQKFELLLKDPKQREQVFSKNIKAVFKIA